MIIPPPFDTYKTFENLKESGLTEKQAEAITQAIQEAFIDAVATKSDIAALELRMVERFEGVSKEFQNLYKSLTRLVAIAITAISAIGALLRYFVP